MDGPNFLNPRQLPRPVNDFEQGKLDAWNDIFSIGLGRGLDFAMGITAMIVEAHPDPADHTIDPWDDGYGQQVVHYIVNMAN